MYALFLSFLTSTFSSWLLSFLVPLIIQDLTHSAFYTALAYGITIVPYIFIMPIGGVLGDRYNKKKLLQLIEFLNGMMVIAFPFIPLKESYIGVMLLLLFLLSSLNTIHHTLFQAFSPMVIQKSSVKKFTASTNLASSLSNIFAPVVAALCCTLSHKTILFYFISVSYFVSFLLISWTHPHTPYKKQPDSSLTIFKDLQEGWSYMLKNPFFKYTVYIFFLVNLGETLVNANLLHYLKNHYSSSDAQIGYYYIPMGIGVLVGSFMAPYIIGRVASRKIVVIGTCFTALFPLLMLFFQKPWMITTLWGLNKMGAAIIGVTFESVRQVAVPRKILTRVIAITRMIAYLSIPLASLAGGWIFEQTNSFSYLLVGSFLSITLSTILFGKALYQSPPVEK